VKSARVMKQSVAHLLPFIEDEKEEGSRAKGKVLLATVKGDVHDIGKNIVGVVLQCNNFEVIDLGVMVPYTTILETAKREDVDAIGLSGLITPSLEEMAMVATEMTRQGFTQPLLIGGATTSKVHTAVKIAPNYSGATVHVVDASRAVGVTSNLVSDTHKDKFVSGVRAEYDTIRETHAGQRKGAKQATLEQARSARCKIDWASVEPPKPSFLGVKSFVDYDFGELVDCIDWTPFFRTWELTGNYPKILQDEVVGEAARSLYDDARAMIDRVIAEKWLEARAVIGFFPANAVGDDVEVYEDNERSALRTEFHFLRQQMAKRDGRFNYSLADFVAPKDSGVADYIGGFAVTAGLRIEDRLKEFRSNHDDYNDILLKAIADRFAEAFAERMHERVRKEFWGYAPDEALDNESLIKERYQGIRPAPGYPACPDHTEKRLLFDLLDAEKNASISLTDSFAMMPASSVSGFYFWHPDSRYFGIGKIGRDQLKDYAARKGVSVEHAERWLASNLA